MTHAQLLLRDKVAQQKSRNKSLVCHQPKAGESSSYSLGVWKVKGVTNHESEGHARVYRYLYVADPRKIMK